MMVAFFIGCGLSLLAIAAAPNVIVLAIAMFALGVFSAIYHPVGMAVLIEASGARGRTLALNGVFGNLGVSLAAGTSALLATWLGWRAAFYLPGLLVLASGVLYFVMTPDDRHHTKSRKSVPSVRLSARGAVILFGLFVVIIMTGGTTFQLLTIALPKIVDEGLAGQVPLVMVGGVATAVLICGAVAQLCIGRLVEYVSPHILFAFITGLGFLGNFWAAHSEGIALMVALAIAIAAIYAQVTVNDMLLARYTADAWRGRVYAIRYFLMFVSAGVAIGMLSLLHDHGGFGLVLAVNAAITFAMFAATLALTLMIGSVEGHQPAPQAAE